MVPLLGVVDSVDSSLVTSCILLFRRTLFICINIYLFFKPKIPFSMDDFVDEEVLTEVAYICIIYIFSWTGIIYKFLNIVY